MDDWITFDGSATKQGEEYRLDARNGNGSVKINAQDVRVTGSNIQVRRGAAALSKSAPKQLDVSQRSQGSTLSGDCPSGRTFCIGLVLFCCDDDRIIGACIGAWDCGS